MFYTHVLLYEITINRSMPLNVLRFTQQVLARRATDRGDIGCETTVLKC